MPTVLLPAHLQRSQKTQSRWTLDVELRHQIYHRLLSNVNNIATKAAPTSIEVDLGTTIPRTRLFGTRLAGESACPTGASPAASLWDRFFLLRDPADYTQHLGRELDRDSRQHHGNRRQKPRVPILRPYRGET
jgi:hypothetical protein